MIITLTGENEFGRRQALRTYIKDFSDKYSDMAIERIDGEVLEYEQIRASVESLPFLTERKLAVVYAFGNQKALNEKIEELIEATANTTDVIFVEPSLDKRLRYYNVLKKRTEFKEFRELDAATMSRWLSAAAKERGGQLDDDNARFLIDRVGLNQQMLDSELDKLLLYDRHITRSSIEQLSEPTIQSTIFELLEAAFNGQTKRAIELYKEQRFLKVEPQQIIALLTWQLHVMVLIKSAGNLSPDQIISETQLNPFVVRKNLSAVRNVSFSKLKELVGVLLEIDVKLKNQNIDPDDALQYFLLRLSVEPNDTD